VNAHQGTVAGVLDYLHLDGEREVSTRHRKVNTASMRELVSNYDEFVECVTREGWEAFLD
jgi:hypothetical protein